MNVRVILDNEESEALNAYAEDRHLPLQGSCKRLVRAGLIKAGYIEPTTIDQDMGVA